jgi:hypothetical protein
MQLLKIEITAHGCVGMAHNPLRPLFFLKNIINIFLIHLFKKFKNL